MDLQRSLVSAQKSANEVLSLSHVDKETERLIKSAVDNINLAHKRVLEAERQKLKNIEVQKAGQIKEMPAGQTFANTTMQLIPKIQRTYKLTSKSSYEVWLDCLRTELTSYQLMYLIDSSLPGPVGLTGVELALQKNFVKDIIISHIDEEYHKKILGMTEPTEILRKLRDSRKGEVMSTPTSIRTKLYNVRMKKGEKAQTFCERFDQIIREHELSDDPVKLTDQEKRSTFYQAIIGIMPEVRRTDSAVIATTGKEMTMEQLRKSIQRIQEDEESHDNSESTPSVSRVKIPKQNKCHRCNSPGHWKQQCPLIRTNQWFCYYCNRVTDHRGDQCPFKVEHPQWNNFKRRFDREDEPSAPHVKRPRLIQSGRGSYQFRGQNFRGRGQPRDRGTGRGSRHQYAARRAEYEEGDTTHQEEEYTENDSVYDKQQGQL
ncbi:uncharacterized protein LOC128198214 [Bicyclus anynana]|uniref:Uncharacterized protein LOC128198214 n=1 Tax=Bicyclus anynana TaxID=110368 RepID=A0ABM3LGZ8_BICAN|nr:uncharacterized protein LOC128198214 [Bicyclus anynana]